MGRALRRENGPPASEQPDQLPQAVKAHGCVSQPFEAVAASAIAGAVLVQVGKADALHRFNQRGAAGRCVAPFAGELRTDRAEGRSLARLAATGVHLREGRAGGGVNADFLSLEGREEDLSNPATISAARVAALVLMSV